MTSNSVFISYRRDVSGFLARSVWQTLSELGVDAFFDCESINAGKFDQIILNQIASRPYFMPILSPGTLERCKDPGDWVLRELEEALRLERIIVPLHTEKFDFSDIHRHLPPNLALELSRYNAMPVPLQFFPDAIKRVHEQFLKPVNLAVIQTPNLDIPIVADIQAEAAAQPRTTDIQLLQQDYLLQGYLCLSFKDYDGAIKSFTKAIEINPKYAEALNARGLSQQYKKNFGSAVDDLNEAIRLNPNLAEAYNNLALTYKNMKNFKMAIVFYTKAIQLEPFRAVIYHNRGRAYEDMNELVNAIKDFSTAIDLAPEYALAYNSRGVVRGRMDDAFGELDDYNNALRLDPHLALAYANRGLYYEVVWGEYEKAIADYRRVLELQSDHPRADEMRELIRQQTR